MHAVGYLSDFEKVEILWKFTAQIVFESQKQSFAACSQESLGSKSFFGKVRSKPEPGPAPWLTPAFTILGQDLVLDFD